MMTNKTENMKTKEYYESVAEYVCFSKVDVDVDKKFVHFHTNLAMLTKDEMNRIISMTENSKDFNFWIDNGFTLNIFF